MMQRWRLLAKVGIRESDQDTKFWRKEEGGKERERKLETALMVVGGGGDSKEKLLCAFLFILALNFLPSTQEDVCPWF